VSDLHEGGKCLALADSVIRHVGTESSDMMVECFPGIRTKQRHTVTDNRNLSQYTVIHVGTNDLRRTSDLDCVMGEVYSLANGEETCHGDVLELLTTDTTG
jgi:hypothetical protein